MKVAVITGVDHGLGFAFVEELLAKDWMVIGGHLLELDDDLNKLVATYGDRLILCQLDIVDDESVKRFGTCVKGAVESVDMLINNGAILGKTDGTIREIIDYEDIIKTININAVGTLRVTNQIVELLLKGNDKVVVNISSEAGSIGENKRDGWFGYSMSKAAMNMGGALIHKSLIPEGGRVIQIHPGYLKTYMNGQLNEEGDLFAEEAAKMILDVVKDQLNKPVEERPAYISYKGETLKW